MAHRYDEIGDRLGSDSDHTHPTCPICPTRAVSYPVAFGLNARPAQTIWAICVPGPNRRRARAAWTGAGLSRGHFTQPPCRRNARNAWKPGCGNTAASLSGRILGPPAPRILRAIRSAEPGAAAVHPRLAIPVTAVPSASAGRAEFATNNHKWHASRDNSKKRCEQDRFWLFSPVRGGLMPDPGFCVKVGTICAYWHEVMP